MSRPSGRDDQSMRARPSTVRTMRTLGASSLVLVVLAGCGSDTEPTALSLDGVPITTNGPIQGSSTTSPATSTSTESTTIVSSVVETPAQDSVAVPTSTDALGPSNDSDEWPLAIDVLAVIPVMRERGDGYDRDLFEHWITMGGCSTRENVLIRDSLSPAQVDPFGCRVVAGDWVSSYDGTTWEDPADVDIDHVVALKEAWDSGAWSWSASQRRAFANDLSDRRTLRVVTDNVNQSKGDKDPSNWMPSLQSAWCPYLADWVAIKARWLLSMDESEAGRIRNLLGRQCSGLRIEPWSAPPVPIAPVGTSLTPTSSQAFA